VSHELQYLTILYYILLLFQLCSVFSCSLFYVSINFRVIIIVCNCASVNTKHDCNHVPNEISASASASAAASCHNNQIIILADICSYDSQLICSPPADAGSVATRPRED